MNRFSLLFITLCALSVPPMAAASDHDLEDALNAQFEGKVVILRHPMGNESLRYDAQGKSLDQGQEGDWTVYGAVRIQKIELGKKQIRLQGTRLCVRSAANGLAPFEFTRPKNPVLAPPVKPSVNVEIKTDQPPATVDQAQALLGNVFALNKDDLLDSVPEFWRTYLDAHLDDYDLKQGKEMQFNAEGSAKRSNSLAQRNTPPPSPSQESQPPLGKIYQFGPNATDVDVKAPKVIFSPEPEFTEAARYEKFQGTLVLWLVVDQAGKVRKVGVVRPLGLGLDESGVTRVKTWTFNPAMRDGKPVSVEMNMEVAFNLY